MNINNSRMISLRMRTIGTITGLLALFAFGSLSAKQERFPLKGTHVEIPLENVVAPLTLSLFLSEGDLTIRGKERSSIEIKFDDSDQDDVGYLTLDTETGVAQMQLSGDQLDTDLKLILPANTSLRIRNQDGDIDIQGIEGSIDVTAGEGMTHIMDITGSVSVTTSDGDIYLRARPGGVSDESASIDSLSGNDPGLNQNSVYRIHASDGDVDIQGLEGDIEVTVGDGEIEMVDIAGSVSSSASDGDIRLRIRDASKTKNITLTCADGDIDLSLPVIPAFSLVARTVDGDVSCSYPFRSKGSSLKEKRPRLKEILFSDQLSFQHNEGGFPILLSTSDGDIRISQN